MNKIARRGLRTILPAYVKDKDSKLFRQIAAWHTPMLDEILPRLSRLADGSFLWLAFAGLFGFLGGRGAKRSSLRGVTSILLTSVIVNIPMKILFRRSRPPIGAVPVLRRMAHPKSTSFPSGHAASAFAFATGATLEMRAIGIPLFTTAGAIAFSRVYVGVHYPSDVIAGAAVGAGIALGLRRFWSVPERGPVKISMKRGGKSKRLDVDGGVGLGVVVNVSSGPLASRDPTQTIRDEFPRARVIEIENGDDIDAVLRNVAEDASSIAIGGGDGSVGVAAKIAIDRKVPLAIFPNGTLNHLALDLGLDTTEDTIAALKKGSVADVDVAEIDGRVFLNTASIGIYPEIVAARERLESRLGKWGALVVAVSKTLGQTKPLDLELDGERMRVWTIFIGNCRYSPRGMAPTKRESLDDGVLDIRVVKSSRAYPRLRMVLSALLGRLGELGVYREWTAHEMKVTSLNGPIQVACDGESFESSSEFRVRKLDRPLTVFVSELESESA